MSNCKVWPRYLLWFAHEHVDFRYAELQSILSLKNIPIRFIEEPSHDKPYCIVEVPSEESVLAIAARSVSLKNCIELWAQARSQKQLHINLKNSLANKTERWLTPIETNEEHDICPGSVVERCCSKSKSFKIEVETFCKHFSLPEKIDKIEGFNYLPLEGPVKLKSPDNTLTYIEFYGIDPNNIPEVPYGLFFGRWVADGQRQSIQRLSLKTRKFIGNTSMDAQLSLLMANQAQVRSGDLVLDPFVGSGSLLVSAAEFGGYVWGSDIDFMMLHGRTRPSRVKQKVRSKDEGIKANMRQYGLENQYLDVFVSDFTLPLWRDGFKFDAIITDPPYGVREPSERIGIERENYRLAPEHLSNHVPSKVEYGLPTLYADLLHFAANNLRVGRRLVCWYPLVRDDYREEQLPSHPGLRLIANSEQVLSKLTSRRLLTYEKVSDSVASCPTDPNKNIPNFREKYFAIGEITRRERKEKKSQEIATNAANRLLSKKSGNTDVI